MVTTIAFLYVVIANLGFQFSYPGTNVTPIWPASGFGFCCIYFLGYQRVIGIFLGAFLANFFAHFLYFPQTSDVILLSTLIGLGNSLETYLGVHLLKYLNQQKDLFITIKNVWFFVFSIFVSCLLAALIGVFSLYFLGTLAWSHLFEVFIVWLLGDFAGILLIFPLCYFIANEKNQNFSLGVLQRVFTFFLILFITYLIFFDVLEQFPMISQPIVLLPLLMYFCFRSSTIDVSIFVLLVCIVAILGTINGLGPYGNFDQKSSLLYLQFFIVMVSISMYVFVGVVQEKDAVENKMKLLNNQLETRILERSIALEESQGKLAESAKLASLGEISAGLAHEVNQPLGIIQLNAEMLKASPEYEEKEKFRLRIDKILRQVHRADKIIQQLKVFGKDGDTIDFEYVDLNELVEQSLAFMYEQIHLDGVKITTDYAKVLPPLFVSPIKISQVISNLLNNAKDAVKNSRIKHIIIKTQYLKHHVVLYVMDSGEGVSLQWKDKIFDPFFTTKDVGKGMGLGLAISYGIIKKYEGEIQLVENKQLSGACFQVSLPVQRKG